MLRQKTLVILLGLIPGVMYLQPLMAQSDTSGTQRIGNTQFGNSLDPTGWAPFIEPDPNGMSYLHADQLRTPTGSLFPYPSLQSTGVPYDHGGWLYSGYLELGYLHTSGNRNDEFFQMYSGWKNGPALGLLAFSAFNPKTGQYAELRGSRISDNDQYYRLRAGQYGNYRIEAFYRDIPHVLSTTAYPLWNGVGGTNLTLPSGLTPAGSTPSQVAAVEAARSRQTLQVNRQSEGISWESRLTQNWIGYAGVTSEHRTGDRDWGGPMFFSYAFGSVGPGGPGTPGAQAPIGGQYETVRPINFTTTDINLGLRNKGGASGWLFNLTGAASFFRDHTSTLSYAIPIPVLLGESSVITGGTWSLEPDNNYYNLRLEASHPFKFWHGEFSASAAYGSMRQNVALQAPLNPMYCPSGQYIGNSGIGCANWNTTAALSEQNGNARIDTGLVNLRLSFRPTTQLNGYVNLRWYDENNMTRYTMYNPLTGQYGYVPENGSEPLITGETELFQPGNPLYQSNFAQIAAIPYSYDDRKVELGGNYQVNPDNSVGLNYLLDRKTPHPRERTYINDQHLKFNWDTRIHGEASLRFSYEYEKRTGSPYNSNPYLNWYSPSLPGYVLSELGYVEWTVAQMYKYDMSNLKASKLKAILTTPIGQTATVTATFYGNSNHYGATIGRQSSSTTGTDISWDWSPDATTSASIYAGLESSRLKQGNVNDEESLIGVSPEQMDDQFGSPMFPYANFWTATDSERDANVGARLSHSFTTRVKLDLRYDYTYSRGLNSYNYASLAAISAAYQKTLTAADVGSSFPPNVYRMQTLTANLNIGLTQQVGLRLYGEYEFGNFADWNYTGFYTPADLVVGNRVFTDLGPSPRWHATVVGFFVTMRL